jgi:hypothetical protein
MCSVPLWLAGLFSCAWLLQAMVIAFKQEPLQLHVVGHVPATWIPLVSAADSVTLSVCADDPCCAHTGIDMTDAQLAFANKHSTAWQQHLGYAQPNMW